MSSSTCEIISDFLHEYRRIKSGKSQQYSAGILENSTLFNEIKICFEGSTFVGEYETLIEALYDQFRSDSPKFHDFSAQFIPIYLLSYLLSQYDKVNNNNITNINHLEGFILGMHNVLIFRYQAPNTSYGNMPSLSQSSLYHDGLTLPGLNDNNFEVIVSDVEEFPRSYINALNRWNILSYLLRYYVSNINQWSTSSKHSFIRLCNRSVSLSILPRIQVSSAFLTEIIYGTYCLMFQESFPNASEAHKRAFDRSAYEIMVNPVMMANAASNSLIMSPPISEDNNHVRLKTPRPSIGGSAITNATFKPEKLPEDIPVVPQENGVVDTSLVTVEMKHEKPKLLKASTLPVLTINGLPSKDQQSTKQTFPTLHFKRFERSQADGDHLNSIAENGSALVKNGSVSDDSDCDK